MCVCVYADLSCRRIDMEISWDNACCVNMILFVAIVHGVCSFIGSHYEHFYIMRPAAIHKHAHYTS